MQTFFEHRIFLSTLLIGVLLLVVITAVVRVTHTPDPAITPNEQASSSLAAVYTDVTGTEVPILDADVSYTVVLHWASWCPQCESLLPAFIDSADRNLDTSVRLLAVNRAEPQSTVVRYLAYLDIPIDHPAILLDANDTLFSVAASYTMPEVAVYDASFEEVERLYEPTQTEIAVLLDELTKRE